MADKATLPEQIEEVQREIRQRERLYPGWIQSGKYKQETADKKLADLRDAAATLQFVEKYADPLRKLIKTLQRFSPYLPDDVMTQADADELLQDPLVREVMREFPGAIPIVHALNKPEPTFDFEGDDNHGEC